MSDYMYLLDSHLTREQHRLLTAVQSAGASLNVAVYLTGGAMRDMLGGFPIRDLDFTFEAPALRMLKAIQSLLPDLKAEEDPLRKIVEVRVDGGVTGSLRMARIEKVSKPGAVPKIVPASILEDLARRDFTMNAIAISLAAASRGLIRDPMNGQSELVNREIRTGYSQAFFDDPSRLIRAFCFKHRFGFQFEARTAKQIETAAEEGWIRTLQPSDWRVQLIHIAEELESSEILRELGAAHLLPVPAESLNLAALAKLEKARRMVSGRQPVWDLFLHSITAGLKPKERTAILKAFGLKESDFENGKKLRTRAAKVGAALKSPQLRRPFHIYNALQPATALEILALLYESDQRIVQDRLRNYLQKYLPTAQEVTDSSVEATGVKLGTPQFAKAKAAMITERLNTSNHPPPAPIPPAPAVVSPTVARTRTAR